ncbi:MAG TPA: type I DNA topoisomerase [Candidatus Saccharimonadales bacterium]|nr:type I DNA topoisomerase [Candidatus Saccharimonadales bacterium]
MNLIIVESPTKAKTLGKFLGESYEVEATMGHIKDLPKSKLGIDVKDNFKPNYEEMPKKLSVIKVLQRNAKKAKMVYIATDPDREGEAIASHVKEIIGDKDSKRITFHEITKEAVEEALAHPREIDKNLVDAQIGRRVLDRLVGYELSPLLWKKVRRGLSAGRVQSVAVRLIVEKEKEIEKFKPVEYWQIFCDVKTKDKKNFTVELAKKEIGDKKTSDQIVSDLEKAKYVIAEVKKRESRKSPYPPFTTSTMTQSAAINFGWSAKRTMRVAQNLYEEGLITYHRTDSTNIAGVAVSKARTFIKKEYGDKYLPDSPLFYKTKSKVAQEAHEAIRPTNPGLITKEDLASDNKKLYQLVWRRFVACQMSKSVFDQTTIEVKADDYLLRASGQIMKFDGWRKVMPLKNSGDEVELPEVVKGDKLDLVKVSPIQKFTEPPARFNEASIIKTLEKLGIGRPSTYAPIITTIQLRQYVEKKEGRFYATPVGIAVTEFLMGNFPEVLDYKFTADMEDSLDKVADGKKEWEKEIKTFYSPFHKKLDDVTKNAKRIAIPTEKLGEKCPECKEGDLVIRIGRFGKFISCSRFPDCKYTAKYLEKIGIKCPKCNEGDVIVKKTSRGRQFFGCSRYPDCDYASWKNPKLEKPKKEKKDQSNKLKA